MMRDLATTDSVAKGLAQEIKRDTDACALGIASMGLPAILAKVFAPSGGDHYLRAIRATMSVFLVFYSAILKLRTSNAELERVRSK